MEKFENDRRLEQMTAERRRREMASYRLEVENIIEVISCLFLVFPLAC